MCSAMADLTQFYGETFHIDWGEKLKKEAVPWKIDFLETRFFYLPERASPDEGVRDCRTKVAQPVNNNLRYQRYLV